VTVVRLRAFALPSLGVTVRAARPRDLWWQLSQRLRELTQRSKLARAGNDWTGALAANKDRLRVRRRLRSLEAAP
jgi:hypothetical protein